MCQAGLFGLSVLALRAAASHCAGNFYRAAHSRGAVIDHHAGRCRHAAVGCAAVARVAGLVGAAAQLVVSHPVGSDLRLAGCAAGDFPAGHGAGLWAWTAAWVSESGRDFQRPGYSLEIRRQGFPLRRAQRSLCWRALHLAARSS